MQVWESAPMMTSPGATRPCSGSSTCSMPTRPTSQKFLMPWRLANSRMSFAWAAALMSLLGVKWSGTRAIFDGSKTLVKPAFSNSAMPIGAVTSLARARSTRASTMSPGLTASRPAARASIFSTIVCPIYVVPFAAAALFMART